MNYITGDVHGNIDIHKFNSNNFPHGKNLRKDDYIIVCGDFGLVWDNNDQELYWREWLLEKPWTTLFVCGNHENFNLLNNLPQVKMFEGVVGKVTDSIFHLKRGEIYNIYGETFFCMGGAYSVDKSSRIEGISWWKEEIPSSQEFNHGLDNLEKHNFKVDYIVGHTGPSSIIAKYIHEKGLDLFIEAERLDTVSKYFESLLDRVEFKKFYMGHFHDDYTIDNKFVVLYNEIIPVGDNSQYPIQKIN
jgi:hypothetical protein